MIIVYLFPSVMDTRLVLYGQNDLFEYCYLPTHCNVDILYESKRAGGKIKIIGTLVPKWTQDHSYLVFVFTYAYSSDLTSDYGLEPIGNSAGHIVVIRYPTKVHITCGLVNQLIRIKQDARALAMTGQGTFTPCMFDSK